MSFATDVNILLYASDAGSPKHDQASRFLAECAAGREVFCLAWLTVMSCLRMATHFRGQGRILLGRRVDSESSI